MRVLDQDNRMVSMEQPNRRQILARATASFVVMPLVAPVDFLPSVAAQNAPSRVSSLLDGSFSLPVAALSKGKTEAAIKAALAAAGANNQTAQSVLNVSVMRRGEDIILFDVGAGPNFVPGTGKLVQALESNGIKPEQVTHVIFSHGHPDHLWGALDDFDTPLFANAKHYFPAVEWDYWFAADIYSRLPEDRHSFAAGAQRILKAMDSQMQRFKGGEELLSGIASIATPGHTPGHMCFEVKTDDGLVFIGADAITHPILSFQHPDWPGSFDEDSAQAAASRHMMLARLAQEKARLVGYHLPNGGMGRVDAKDGAYRFIQG